METLPCKGCIYLNDVLVCCTYNRQTSKHYDPLIGENIVKTRNICTDIKEMRSTGGCGIERKNYSSRVRVGFIMFGSFLLYVLFAFFLVAVLVRSLGCN